MQNIELAAAYYEMIIITSNQNFYSIFSPAGFDTDDLPYRSMANSVTADMDASDTAYLTIRQGGTSQDETADMGVDTFLSGFLAC